MLLRTLLPSCLALVLACDRRAPNTASDERTATPPSERRATDEGASEPSAGGKDVLRPAEGSADRGAPAVGLKLVAKGPERVTDIEFVPGKPDTFVVTGQQGQARVYQRSETAEKLAEERGVMLDLEVESEVELGLLSVAFHPRYVQNGRLFVHYNPKGKQLTRISEFRLPSDKLGSARAQEVRVLLEREQPYRNHNGGELAFGPDGKLYVGLGDGGAAGDPRENGQDLSTLLGTVLRLDVDGERLVPQDNPFVGHAGARPEIYAYGLRNPWKISFDTQGRLVAADVGQNRFEEVDVILPGDNLGWDEREAAHCFEPKSGCRSKGLVDPVFEYGREQGQSITGGFVYTGKRIEALAGRYVFGDFLSRRLWALRLPDDRSKQAESVVLGVFDDVGSASLGRDGDGELYISDFGSGNIYQLVAL